MRISVIIPTYNSGPLVVQAVESVLAQTLPASEVIVVDDGSTDDTQERLASYRGRIEYHRQANARVAAARNAGLDRASGDLIAFLDADDAWHPRKLERQVDTLKLHPEIGLLATDWVPWPGDFDQPSISGGSIREIPLSKLLVTNCLTTSSVVVRREVLDAAGRFDPELFGPEDYDLWLRCTQIAKAAVLCERLTGYRDCSGSVGKQAASMRRGLLKIHEKLDAAGVWTSRRHRRKCRAHVDYSTAYLDLVAGNSRLAAALLLRSLWTYPLPMSRTEVRYPLGRVRLLLRAVLRCIPGLIRKPTETTDGPSSPVILPEVSK